MTRSTRITCFFAPLRPQDFRKFSSKIFAFFGKHLQNFDIFEFFSLIFAQILMKFCRNFADNLENSEIFEFSRGKSYFERIRMVRMVRSLADRTFQLWLLPKSVDSLLMLEVLFTRNLSGTYCARVRGRGGKIGKFENFLQIFGGLVLGCTKTKFCKKICVRQHFSSSTRFASFCTAAISKFSQKIGLKKQQFS